jgi:predicted transcriptional regulator
MRYLRARAFQEFLKSTHRPASAGQRSMASKSEPTTNEFQGLEPELAAQLPNFELFFRTFGFKRVHGRVFGLLVLAGQALSSREIAEALELSTGATSTTLHDLAEWGAVDSEFDSGRRCHLHRPVGNTLSIAATVFRRREQVVFRKFRGAAESTLQYVIERYGPRDPRVLSLRSIISSCEIAEAVMQLVFSSVERALGDSESVLAKAVNAALKVGLSVPARMAGPDARSRAQLASRVLERLEDEGRAARRREVRP